jgi:Tol biopolymer transport system component
MIGRLIGVAAVLAAASASAVPAGATPPGANGDIFYHGVTMPGPSDAGIWRVHADGTGAQQLPLGALAVDPRVSPDGTRLLYSVFGQPTDFLANVDGSDSQAVPFAGGAWYPNGTQVVFSLVVSRRGSAHPKAHLFRENLDGTGLKRLTSGRNTDGDPAVSPDGTQIAFDRGGTEGVLMRMPAAGGTPIQVGSDLILDGPDWSPDGARLVYVCVNQPDSTHDLCVINADGSGRRVIWHAVDERAGQPVWSPDGTQIAFDVGFDTPPFLDIWRVNADGSDPTLITATPGGASGPNWQPLVG